MEFMDNENHRMHDKRTKYRFKILKLTYGIYKNKLSLFTCFICIFHFHSSIHFTPKRQNTTIFMYKQTFSLKYTILRRRKYSINLE